MSRRSSLISTLIKHIKTEAKSTITTAARNGFKSVGEYIKESSADPNRQLNLTNLLTALKTGVLSTGQQKAILPPDLSNKGSAGGNMD